MRFYEKNEQAIILFVLGVVVFLTGKAGVDAIEQGNVTGARIMFWGFFIPSWALMMFFLFYFSRKKKA